jgi:hypothetical protein
MDIKQPGVTGLIDTAGRMITGDLTIEGGLGVTTSTYVDGGGVRVLEININGVTLPDDTDCGLPPPITQLCAVHAIGSLVDVSSYAVNTLALSGHALCLDDLCAAKKARQLPDSTGKLPVSGRDVCNPTPTPPVPVLDCPNTVCVVPADGQAINLVAPSLPGCNNPVSVRASTGTPVMPSVRFGSVRVLGTDPDKLVDRSSDPPFACRGLTIGLKGLTAVQGAGI